MAGRIICLLVCLGCGLVFYVLGIYASKLEKPMHFYTGTQIDANTITDIRQYNQENARMWKWYSLWYFVAGIVGIWSTFLCVAFMCLGCSVGIVLLVIKYHRILKKYSK
ncbi:MAG: hypothetical protein UIM26_02095 [Longicatena sp.]|nr:hypothetical protein [Longicatena sp.]